MTTVFFGGVPTEPDVEKLFMRWPEKDLKPGDVIKYSDIATVIGVPVEDTRWQTVTQRWRRKLETAGLYFKCVDGAMFVVMTEAEKAGLAVNRLAQAGKKALSAVAVSHRTDRSALDEVQRARLDWVEGSAAKIRAVTQLRRKIALPEV